MKILLASASPRRRELLAQIGLEFEVRVSEVEERITAASPGEIVEELASQKARAVLQTEAETEGELLVIGADTVVALDGQIMGKPADAAQAGEMLRLLSGRGHEVYTGVCLLYRRGTDVRQRQFHNVTQVHFYEMSGADIASYVATGDPLDKAGAYGIQGLCARYIRGIEGDYNNVVGLPVGRLYQEMKEMLSQ